MRTEARHTIRASPVSRTGNAKHDRNSFYPVSLTAIADAKENYELENKISQLQESLGREMTEKKPVGPKADKSEIADRIDILINIAKREVPIDIIKLEEYGDIAFGTGRLKESLDAYETAAIWGSKTSAEKIACVARHIFNKPNHICDHTHNTNGWCSLRNKAIIALQSVGFTDVLNEIGEMTQRQSMHHCAILSYKAAVESGSLEARQKLIELGKKLKNEDPLLSKIAFKCARMKDIKLH